MARRRALDGFCDRRGFLKSGAGAFIAAAGIAAALAADAASRDVHSVDVRTLQRKLKDFGAYLPNA